MISDEMLDLNTEYINTHGNIYFSISCAGGVKNIHDFVICSSSS